MGGNARYYQTWREWTFPPIPTFPPRGEGVVDSEVRRSHSGSQRPLAPASTFPRKGGKDCLAFLLVALFLTACAPARQAPAGQAGGGQASDPARASEPSRTLIMVARFEPTTLTMKPLVSIAANSDSDVRRLFNAGMVLVDATQTALPYLADARPQLNTDTWRVSPDGQMETTYRLRQGATWHDGHPLTANDFVFSWRVYATPELGLSRFPPAAQLEEVVAPDPQTVVFRWKTLFPDADILDAEEFTPLPRHILEEPLQRGQAEAFAALPYWTVDYVGLGPYRIERWEPGSYLEASAFPGHVLGKPRIERLQVRFIGDSNSVLANLLSGDAHISFTNAIFLQQAVVLKREWSGRNGGNVIIIPNQWRRAEVQHRPAYTVPAGILDVRVKRALAHAIDRDALNDSVFEGEGIVTHTPLPATVPYAVDLDRAIAKYPFDPRRVEQLMGEAGWTRGADSVFVHPSEGRFTMEIRENATADLATELSIMASGLRTVGYDVKETLVPLSQANDGEIRGAFPALYVAGGGVGERGVLPNYLSSTISRAENRWVGRNRAGWSNQEYDRLFEQFQTTLDRTERNRQAVAMARIFSEEIPAISLYFNPVAVAQIGTLRGPATFAPESVVSWNIYEWTWAQ